MTHCIIYFIVVLNDICTYMTFVNLTVKCVTQLYFQKVLPGLTLLVIYDTGIVAFYQVNKFTGLMFCAFNIKRLEIIDCRLANFGLAAA